MRACNRCRAPILAFRRLRLPLSATGHRTSSCNKAFASSSTVGICERFRAQLAQRCAAHQMLHSLRCHMSLQSFTGLLCLLLLQHIPCVCVNRPVHEERAVPVRVQAEQKGGDNVHLPRGRMHGTSERAEIIATRVMCMPDMCKRTLHARCTCACLMCACACLTCACACLICACACLICARGATHDRPKGSSGHRRWYVGRAGVQPN